LVSAQLERVGHQLRLLASDPTGEKCPAKFHGLDRFSAPEIRAHEASRHGRSDGLASRPSLAQYRVSHCAGVCPGCPALRLDSRYAAMAGAFLASPPCAGGAQQSATCLAPLCRTASATRKARPG